MIREILEVLLMLVPRYVTDRVALAYDAAGSLQVYCLEGEEIDGDELYIECYGTIRTFTWLNMSKGGWVYPDLDK